MTSDLKHEDFCLPRPGETEPRTETYTATRSDSAGQVTSRPVVHRCVECGAQTVSG